MKYTTWAELIDHLYYGDEIIISYCNKRYFVQGHYKKGLHHLECWDPDDSNPCSPYFFEVDKKTRQECVNEFLKAQIFEGKVIEEIFEQAELVDW